MNLIQSWGDGLVVFDVITYEYICVYVETVFEAIFCVLIKKDSRSVIFSEKNIIFLALITDYTFFFFMSTNIYFTLYLTFNKYISSE